MPDEKNPNQAIQDSGLLGNDPASQGQNDGTAAGSNQGTQGLSEADVRRIALQIAQSTASKAENRVNQKVQGQVGEIKATIASLARQNPNLKLSEISEEQIRNAQREAVINSIADQMLNGEVPGQNAQIAAANRTQPQGQAGQQSVQMNLTPSEMDAIKIRAEEIFAEEGTEVYAEDPEAADIDTTSRGRMLVTLREAAKKKAVRLSTNPQARIPSQGVGAAGGSMVAQFQADKAKLPRGQARPKALQELRMKYQKMGLKDNELD